MTRPPSLLLAIAMPLCAQARADGNVSQIPLPGGLSTMINEARDELVEAAIRIIRGEQ